MAPTGAGAELRAAKVSAKNRPPTSRAGAALRDSVIPVTNLRGSDAGDVEAGVNELLVGCLAPLPVRPPFVPDEGVGLCPPSVVEDAFLLPVPRRGDDPPELRLLDF